MRWSTAIVERDLSAVRRFISLIMGRAGAPRGQLQPGGCDEDRTELPQPPRLRSQDTELGSGAGVLPPT